MPAVSEDFNLQPAQAPRCHVQFYRRPKQNAEKSATEGRPIVEMLEYVKMSIPGDKTTQIDRPVRESDMAEYRAQYEAFKADKDQDTASGTLISAWGQLPPERVEELSLSRVRTVEQLAEVSDANIQRLGPGALDERTKARRWLELTRQAAPIAKFEAEREKMLAELASLKQALKDQGDHIAKLEKRKGA